MDRAYNWLIPILWGVFWGYWGFAAFQTGKTERTESSMSGLLHVGLVAFAFGLVGIQGLSIGPLAWKILPHSRIIQIAGITILTWGLIFAIWARAHLGRNWSGTITIKANHKLIRTGPYAWARHPIYTGVLVGMIGTTIAVGELRGLLAMGLMSPISERFSAKKPGWSGSLDRTMFDTNTK